MTTLYLLSGTTGVGFGRGVLLLLIFCWGATDLEFTNRSSDAWTDSTVELAADEANFCSSCVIFSSKDFCFCSMSLKNFKARATFGQQKLQKNIIFGEALLRIAYSSSEIPAHSRCSHLKQHSHSTPSSTALLLHLIDKTSSPDLSLDFLVGGDEPPDPPRFAILE